MITRKDAPGWAIEYTQGHRLATLYYKGKPVETVQPRPWDWERNPSEQEPHEVTDTLLSWLLLDYVMDNGHHYV